MFILSPTEHVDCSTNPCEHGAGCTEAGAGPFHCFCSWPYYGQRCESRSRMVFRFIQFSLIKEVYIYASLTAIFCRSHSMQSICVLDWKQEILPILLICILRFSSISNWFSSDENKADICDISTSSVGMATPISSRHSGYSTHSCEVCPAERSVPKHLSKSKAKCWTKFETYEYFLKLNQ